MFLFKSFRLASNCFLKKFHSNLRTFPEYISNYQEQHRKLQLLLLRYKFWFQHLLWLNAYLKFIMFSTKFKKISQTLYQLFKKDISFPEHVKNRKNSEIIQVFQGFQEPLASLSWLIHKTNDVISISVWALPGNKGSVGNSTWSKTFH